MPSAATNGFVSTRLARIELLRDFEEPARTSLLEGATRQIVEKNSTIFVPGDPPALYAVMRGRVAITMLWDGLRLPLFSRFPGEVFGEISLVFKRQLNEARAAECSEVLRFEARGIHKALEESRSASRAMMRLLAKRMALAEAQTLNGFGGRVRERVELFLARLAAHGGAIDCRGVLLPYRVTQDEIAQSVRASRVAVQRALKQLRREGKVVIDRRRIFFRPSGKYRENPFFT
jgi:CRP-like cAMP-binding protein